MGARHFIRSASAMPFVLRGANPQTGSSSSSSTSNYGPLPTSLQLHPRKAAGSTPAGTTSISTGHGLFRSPDFDPSRTTPRGLSAVYPPPRIAASRLAATSSRSSSNKSAYTSSVIDAMACPSIRCTAFTLAPALTARLAAVRRRSCGVIVGNVCYSGCRVKVIWSMSSPPTKSARTGSMPSVSSRPRRREG